MSVLSAKPAQMRHLAPSGPDAAPPARSARRDDYEPVFYRQPWRPARRWLLWTVLMLAFLAAPAALAITLAGH